MVQLTEISLTRLSSFGFTESLLSTKLQSSRETTFDTILHVYKYHNQLGL